VLQGQKSLKSSWGTRRERQKTGRKLFLFRPANCKGEFDGEPGKKDRRKCSKKNGGELEKDPMKSRSRRGKGDKKRQRAHKGGGNNKKKETKNLRNNLPRGSARGERKDSNSIEKV